MKIYGVVVLYNPTIKVLDNINSYINYVDKLYIIDNSEKKNKNLIKKIKEISKKCIYIDNITNKGIAYSLNFAARLSINEHATWLLTMDQDSKFAPNSLEVLINKAKTIQYKKVGILSPTHVEYERENINILYETSKEELVVMTSGNLLNLEAYSKVGKFKNKYFIDYVDHEYCLRLNKNGFKIIRVTNSILFHSLGNSKTYNVFGKKVVVTNHSPLRRYYITRNSLDVYFRYFKYYPIYSIKGFKSLISNNFFKIILFEKNKIKKLKYVSKGIIDFIKNKFNKN